MGLERALAWLAALLACIVTAFAYTTPGVVLPDDTVAATLVAVVALPFLFVFGRLLLGRPDGVRGWS